MNLFSLFAFNAKAVQQWMRGKQSHGDNEKEQGSQEKNSQFGGRRRRR